MRLGQNFKGNYFQNVVENAWSRKRNDLCILATGLTFVNCKHNILSKCILIYVRF